MSQRQGDRLSIALTGARIVRISAVWLLNKKHREAVCQRASRILGLGVVFLAAAANATNGPNIVGGWARQDGTVRITVSPCGDALCAVNTWVRDPDSDEKVGDTLVMTLHPVSPTALSGHAYDQRRRMDFSMHISLGASGMQTKGCVMLDILCKSTEWTRDR
jgi:uncharacterized protein (DUF2147 family)